jgi:hypothetical protein
VMRRDVISHLPLLDRLSDIGRLMCPHGSRRSYWDGRQRKSHPTWCKRWSCAVCAVINARIVEVLIESGIWFAARERLSCWLATFTSPTGAASVSDYERGLHRMKATPGLKASLGRSVWTIGLHKSGAPHIHAVLVEPQVSKTTVKQAADDAGLGFTDLKTIGRNASDARYVARYVARELPTVAALRLGRINRPASFSRHWPAGGITEGRALAFEALREQRRLAARTAEAD